MMQKEHPLGPQSLNMVRPAGCGRPCPSSLFFYLSYFVFLRLLFFWVLLYLLMQLEQLDFTKGLPD